MNFTIEVYEHDHNSKRIWLETNEVRMIVAELREVRRGWEVAYFANAGLLRPTATLALEAYCKDQLALINITRRMLA